MTHLLRGLTLALGLALLAACDSPEQRAEKHYENGVALLAEGDRPRAYVEFRNALQEQSDHLPTLQAYTAALEAEGNLRAAYGLRRRIAEITPEDPEQMLQVALLAIRLQDWAEAARYRAITDRISKGDLRAELVALAVDYQALVADNPTRQPQEAEMLVRARALAEALPDSDIPHQILLDGLVRAREDRAALAEAEVLVAREPDNPLYHRSRLMLLNRLGDTAGVEAELRDMVARFPDDDQAQAGLIGFYISQNNVAAAERFLRERIEPGQRDDGARLNLVAFLAQIRGADAARAALQDFVSEGTSPDLFRSRLAAMDYQDGQRDKAMAELQQIIAGAEPSSQTRGIKVMLARMQLDSGNLVGAQKLVEELLAEDGSMVEALQVQAQMQIQADDPEAAIVSLRRALNQEPDDGQTLTLLSQAYLRNGDRELAGEALSQAAQATGFRTPEALRYAQFLMQDQKWMPAEDVLLSALRRTPDTPELLVPLAQIYLQIEDWPRAGQVERNLREIGTPQMLAQADELHARILAGQQRASDALAYLENAAESDGASVASQVALLRARLSQGDIEGARSFLDRLLARDPGNDIYRLLDPALKNVMGDHEGARDAYRALLTEMPDRERLWLELYRTEIALQDPAAAMAVLDEGLARLPEAPDLNWAKASELERIGDIEGAIAIYEVLYERSSNSSILANNLASLLATSRDDPESLERAWAVARRLRDSDLPAFQDTYGWIAYRRGDLGEALRNLEPAAAGLPDDASVQYHLGALYAALPARRADAERQLQVAISTGERLDTPAGRAAAAQARAELERLRSAGEGPVTGQ
ncbi:MAG: tetratricopeptide repeat protein [Defluviimonas sp.]|nr:tetratricopeptide repeat protein [Defluviimonas sp.]